MPSHGVMDRELKQERLEAAVRTIREQPVLTLNELPEIPNRLFLFMKTIEKLFRET